MKSIDKTKILLGVAIGCALAAGGLYSYFFIAMKSKTDESINLSTRLNAFSGEQLHYASTASALQNQSADVAKISSYFIKESEIVTFAKKIELLGKDAGVALSIVSLDPVIAQGADPALSFKLTADGKFENVERLLVLLQNFPGKFVWKTVRLSREGGIPVDTGKGRAGTSAASWRVEVSLEALNFVSQ